MNWRIPLAALFALLAFAGCAPATGEPGQVPNAPYQEQILAIPAVCTDRRTGASPRSELRRPFPLVLGPPRVSPAERVQFFPASKPATGTALDISLPSIRNTRPCDADNRVFNAS